MSDLGWERLYCELMRDIRLRHRVIFNVLDGTIKIGRRPAYELCYLELRMICELLAISSLVVHGDIDATQTSRMRSAYEADWILRAMQKIHPDFYPVPLVAVEENGKTTLVDNSKKTIKRDEVISLYRRCGQMLHIGPLKDLANEELTKEKFLEIARWGNRIRNLIDSHAIRVLHREEMDLFWVTIDDELIPHVQFLKRLDGPPDRPPGTEPVEQT
jgi:hypothetical protein